MDVPRRSRGASGSTSLNAAPEQGPMQRSLLPAVKQQPDRTEKAARNHGPGTKGQKQQL